jgi:hypothetical protein
MHPWRAAAWLTNGSTSLLPELVHSGTMILGGGEFPGDRGGAWPFFLLSTLLSENEKN